MATKERLIEIIEKAIRQEDGVIPLYTQHVSSTLFVSGFDKDTRNQISATMKKLANESLHHKELLEELLEKIKGSERHVY